MYGSYEDRKAARQEAQEHAFDEWCADNGLDPEDSESAVYYEEAHTDAFALRGLTRRDVYGL